MIQPVYVIKPFDPPAAVVLIVITGVIGYIFGFVGAIIWNPITPVGFRSRPSGTREVAAGLPSEMHWGCSGSLRWQLS